MRNLRHMVLALLVVFGLVAGPAGAALGQDEPAIVVGSLSFTESAILGDILALLLEDAGYAVERRADLGVTSDAHAALVAGEIDLYVEYTGGGLVSVLGQPVPAAAGGGTATPAASTSIADQTWDAVAAGYLDEFGLVWLDEFGFNNTYALAVTAATAEAYDLETVSDIAPSSGDLVLGSDLEFPDREDGLPGLEAAYGIEFGEVQSGEPALMYESIASGEVDVIAAYATDGRLPDLDLVLLEDDLAFFPPYFAAPVVDGTLLENDPALTEVLNQLSGQIDDATMAGLNRQVDVEGLASIDVARTFLTEAGLL